MRGGLVERAPEIVVADLGQSAPRRHARTPESLCLPHVPDPGHEPLVEHGIADRSARMPRTQPSDHRVEVGWPRQDVRPDTAHRALVQLENRTVHLHRFQPLPAQDEPGPPEDRRPRGRTNQRPRMRR